METRGPCLHFSLWPWGICYKAKFGLLGDQCFCVYPTKIGYSWLFSTFSTRRGRLSALEMGSLPVVTALSPSTGSACGSSSFFCLSSSPVSACFFIASNLFDVPLNYRFLYPDLMWEKITNTKIMYEVCIWWGRKALTSHSQYPIIDVECKLVNNLWN